jgi:ABC-type glutathione transport system ATPase component
MTGYMTYSEAREKMFEICEDSHFMMEETVPQRPLKYCRPSYQVATVIGGTAILSGNQSSWKKAVNRLVELIKENQVVEPEEEAAS